MKQEPAHKPEKRPRGLAARLARWWREFSDSVGKTNPAVVAIERAARGAWALAKFVAVIPALLIGIPAIPLILLGMRIERAGSIGKRLHWVLTAPAMALIWPANVAGWALVLLLLWRYLTHGPLRTSVNDTAKFVASFAIFAGTVPLFLELSSRLDVRFSVWGLGERFSRRLASCIALLMWLILVALLVYYGVLALPPEP